MLLKIINIQTVVTILFNYDGPDTQTSFFI
jgi:hypothetical protein